MSIMKVVVEGTVKLVSSSERQIERCFDMYANCGEDYEVEVQPASSAELKKWKEALN